MDFVPPLAESLCLTLNSLQLAKRRSSGKLKTSSSEQSSCVRKTEASSKPASISASTDEIAVEGRSEHQEQVSTILATP